MKNFVALFDVRGRLSRGKYWLAWLIIFILNLGLSVLILDRLDSAEYIGIVFTLYFFLIILGIKRMHDVGYSGWYVLVPVYNLVLSLTPGEEGPNDYGPDPLSSDEDLQITGDVLDQNLFSTEKISVDDQLHTERDSIRLIIYYTIITYCFSLIVGILFRVSENFMETYQSPLFQMIYSTIETCLLFYFLATVRSNTVRAVFLLMAICKLIFAIIYAFPISSNF